MTTPPLACLGALVLLCLVCGTTDFLRARIPNVVTFPAMGIGLACWAITDGLVGLGYAALGLVVGGLIFFPAFAYGQFGAGDVKMMAAIGALGGWPFILLAIVYSLAAGLVMAVGLLLVQGRLWATLTHLGYYLGSTLMLRRGSMSIETDPANPTLLPMGVAIAVGSLFALADAVWGVGIL